MPLGLLEAPGGRGKFPERTSQNTAASRQTDTGGRRWVLVEWAVPGKTGSHVWVWRATRLRHLPLRVQFRPAAWLETQHCSLHEQGVRRTVEPGGDGSWRACPSRCVIWNSLPWALWELWPRLLPAAHPTAHCTWTPTAMSSECCAGEYDHKTFINWPTCTGSPDLLIHCLKADFCLLSCSDKKKTEWYLSPKIAQHCDGR